jgi:hypothetical protein
MVFMRFNQFAALAAFAVSIPAVSQAQLGGLVRKAKDAAANKIVENKNLKPSSAFGPELTAESLDGVLRGLAAADAKLDEADRLRSTRVRYDQELSKSLDAHEKDREAYDAKVRSTETCQSGFQTKRNKENQAMFDAKIKNNPAGQAQLMQAVVQIGEKLAFAQQKGDTAEQRRLTLELYKAQGLDPIADSVAMIKNCGAVPGRPAWLVEQDSLRHRSARTDSQIRDAESGAQGAGAAASGLSSKEYALARERVMHWYMEARGASPIQHFGGDERKLMESKRQTIERFSRALQGGI